MKDHGGLCFSLMQSRFPEMDVFIKSFLHNSDIMTNKTYRQGVGGLLLNVK